MSLAKGGSSDLPPWHILLQILVIHSVSTVKVLPNSGFSTVMDTTTSNFPIDPKCSSLPSREDLQRLRAAINACSSETINYLNAYTPSRSEEVANAVALENDRVSLEEAFHTTRYGLPKPSESYCDLYKCDSCLSCVFPDLRITHFGSIVSDIVADSQKAAHMFRLCATQVFPSLAEWIEFCNAAPVCHSLPPVNDEETATILYYMKRGCTFVSAYCNTYLVIHKVSVQFVPQMLKHKNTFDDVDLPEIVSDALPGPIKLAGNVVETVKPVIVTASNAVSSTAEKGLHSISAISEGLIKLLTSFKDFIVGTVFESIADKVRLFIGFVSNLQLSLSLPSVSHKVWSWINFIAISGVGTALALKIYDFVYAFIGCEKDIGLPAEDDLRSKAVESDKTLASTINPHIDPERTSRTFCHIVLDFIYSIAKHIGGAVNVSLSLLEAMLDTFFSGIVSSAMTFSDYISQGFSWIKSHVFGIPDDEAIVSQFTDKLKAFLERVEKFRATLSDSSTSYAAADLLLKDLKELRAEANSLKGTTLEIAQTLCDLDDALHALLAARDSSPEPSSDPMLEAEKSLRDSVATDLKPFAAMTEEMFHDELSATFDLVAKSLVDFFKRQGLTELAQRCASFHSRNCKVPTEVVHRFLYALYSLPAVGTVTSLMEKCRSSVQNRVIVLGYDYNALEREHLLSLLNDGFLASNINVEKAMRLYEVEGCSCFAHKDILSEIKSLTEKQSAASLSEQEQIRYRCLASQFHPMTPYWVVWEHWRAHKHDLGTVPKCYISLATRSASWWSAITAFLTATLSRLRKLLTRVTDCSWKVWLPIAAVLGAVGAGLYYFSSQSDYFAHGRAYDKKDGASRIKLVKSKKLVENQVVSTPADSTETFTIQMRNHNVQDLILNGLVRNLCVLGVLSETGARISSKIYGLGLHDREIVTAAHFLSTYDYKSNHVLYIQLATGAEVRVPSHLVTYKVDNTSDLVLINIEFSAMDRFKDIRSFIHQGDLKDTVIVDMALLSSMNPDPLLIIGTGRAMTNIEYDINGTRVCIANAVVFDHDSHDGDCGLPYIILLNGSIKLLGIHIAGDGKKHALCAPLYYAPYSTQVMSFPRNSQKYFREEEESDDEIETVREMVRDHNFNEVANRNFRATRAFRRLRMKERLIALKGPDEGKRIIDLREQNMLRPDDFVTVPHTLLPRLPNADDPNRVERFRPQVRFVPTPYTNQSLFDPKNNGMRPQMMAPASNEKNTTSSEMTKFTDIEKTLDETDITAVIPIDSANANPYDASHVNEALTRTYQVHEFAWSGSDVYGTLIHTLDFPYLLSNTTFISSILQYYRFLRSGVKVSVRVNSTPFHSGQLLISWLPCYNPATPTIDKMACIQQASQNPCVILSANTNRTVEFTIPYQNPQLYWDIVEQDVSSTYRGLFGGICVYVLAPLRQVNSASTPSVTCSVFASFVEPELAGPREFVEPASPSLVARPRPMKKKVPKLIQVHPPVNPEVFARELNNNNFKPQTESKPTDLVPRVVEKPVVIDRDSKSKERESRSKTGLTSDKLRSVASWVGVAKGVPILGEYSVMGSLALKLAAEVSAYFGYGKPRYMKLSKPIIPKTTSEFATGSGLQDASILGLSPDNEVVSSSTLYSQQVDYDYICHFVRIPGIMRHGSFTSTKVHGELIDYFPVSPVTYESSSFVITTNTVVVAFPPPCGLAALLHSYWRGSMQYMIRFVTTKFITCRIVIIWSPQLPENSITVIGNVIKQIVDITGDTTVIFNVPYLKAFPWSAVRANIANSTQISAEINGYISMYIMNPIVSADSSIDTTISYNIWAAGGPDFQLVKPRATNLQSANLAAETMFHPQSKPVDYENPRTLFLTDFPPLVRGKAVVYDGYVMGEVSKRWTEVCSRYCTISSTTATAGANYTTCSPHSLMTTWSSFGVPPTATSALQRALFAMFHFTRGSYRVSLSVVCNTSVATTFVSLNNSLTTGILGPVDSGAVVVDHMVRRFAEIQIPYYSRFHRSTAQFGGVFLPAEMSLTGWTYSDSGSPTVSYRWFGAVGDDFSVGWPSGSWGVIVSVTPT